MRSLRTTLVFFVLASMLVALVGAVVYRMRRFEIPPTPTVIERVREAARLETLDVRLYKKIAFAPDPAPAASLWGDVASWLRYSLRAPRGKAIVFAEAHLGLDLTRLGPESIRVDGREVTLMLPPVRVTIELKAGETEILESNLDSAQTAQLLELARQAFEREVLADARLIRQARIGAEHALATLLRSLGFSAVYFAEAPAGQS